MADEILGVLGARIRQMRLARGWSQRELGGRASVSPRFLVQLESGEGNVSVRRLADVAGALGASLVSLLAGLGPVDDLADRFAAKALSLDPVGAADLLDGLRLPSIAKVSLLGLRGAGKTAVGRQAAARIGCPFVELDRRVEEQAGMTLAEVFEYHGPERYRELSVAALRQVLAQPAAVVLEVGGSVVLDPTVLELLDSRTRLVWLRATAEEHLRRVRAQGDTRPMAGRADPLGELRAILAAREPLYARAAHHVDTVNAGEMGAVDAVVAVALAPSRTTASTV